MNGTWNEDGARTVPVPPAKLLPALAIAVLAIAIALRLWNFAGGRSFWLDEAMIGLNIIHLPVTALFGDLKFDQMAPIGWLTLEKLSFAIWPNADYSLRAVSLVGGIAAVLIFWRLARSLLAFPQAVLAVALFGLTSNLIRYSVMVKPYILDALFSAAILVVAVRLVTDEQRRGKRTLLLALLGIVCVPLAFSGLFVLASTGLVLFARAVAQRDWRWAGGLATTGLAWAAVFVAIYLFSYAKQATTLGSMNAYWSGAFAPVPTSLHTLAWYPQRGLYLLASLHTSFFYPRLIASILGAAALVGAAGFARREVWILLLLLAPFVIAIAASAAHAYPFAHRLQLSLAPPLFILAARGAGVIAAATPYRRLVLTAAAAVLVAGPMVFTASQAGQRPPWAWEEVKPNLERLAQGRAPQDIVFVSEAAELPLLIYARQAGLSGLAYHVTTDTRCDLAALPTHGRAWLLTYHERVSETSRRLLMFDSLKVRGEVSMVGDEKGSKLYRIELTSGGPPSPAAPVACGEPRDYLAFRHQVAKSQGLTPLTPEGVEEVF